MNKFDEQNQLISKFMKQNEELQSIVEKQESKIKFEIQNKQNEQDQLISKYQMENQKLQLIVEEQKIKIKEIEEKIEQMKNIICQINVGVDSNQIIKGEIKIIDILNRIDKKKSKFILNTDASPRLKESEYQKGQTIEKLTQKFSFIKPPGIYYVHALIVDTSGNKSEIMSDSLLARGVKSITFNYTGEIQSIQLPKGSYKLEVWGAEGGTTQGYDESPGLGGYSAGTLNLKDETTLFVYVGEHPTTSEGGWNGGGSASSPAAGGGGSTDISLYGEEGSSQWKNDNHLYSRIIVAGGGGGSGLNKSPDLASGCGGGLCGGDGRFKYEPIKGGGQTFVKINNYDVSDDQGFGVGGSNTRSPSSGGGGGWYGGCAYNRQGGWGPGAAGGSGYTYNSSSASNYPSGCKLNSTFYLSDSKTLAGNKEFPNCSGDGQEKGHSGNGYAKITPLRK